MHQPLALHRRTPLLDRELVVPIALAYAAGALAVLLLSFVTNLGVLLYLMVAALVGSLFVGRFLGRVLWPRLGLGASKLALRFHLRGRERGALLHLTPFQDFPSTLLRKSAEGTAFATGLAVIFAASLSLLLDTASVKTLATAACAGLLGAVLLTFVLVPRWLFSRLGARIEERATFIVRSIAEQHGRLMHVSDGAIIVFALVYGVNVLATSMDRLEGGLLVAGILLGLASVGVVVMATGAAYFAREEPRLVSELSAYAKRLGFNDRWRP